METKKLSVEFEEVKVCKILVDLGDLKQYMSSFLSLKNHERETPEILEVRGFRDSSRVRVVILIDENEIEENEVKHCTDFVEQFGKISNWEVENVYILDLDANSVQYKLDCYDGIYLYD